MIELELVLEASMTNGGGSEAPTLSMVIVSSTPGCAVLRASASVSVVTATGTPGGGGEGGGMLGGEGGGCDGASCSMMHELDGAPSAGMISL